MLWHLQQINSQKNTCKLVIFSVHFISFLTNEIHHLYSFAKFSHVYVVIVQKIHTNIIKIRKKRTNSTTVKSNYRVLIIVKFKLI